MAARVGRELLSFFDVALDCPIMAPAALAFDVREQGAGATGAVSHAAPQAMTGHIQAPEPVAVATLTYP